MTENEMETKKFARFYQTPPRAASALKERRERQVSNAQLSSFSSWLPVYTFFFTNTSKHDILLSMNFEELVKLTRDMPAFELAYLTRHFDSSRDAIRVQLSRWMSQGKVIGLRRGLYTLSDEHRRVALEPAEVANALYRPSYLSTLWALSYYKLIPEKISRFTCLTTRVPRNFENQFGVYDYRTIKVEVFFGFQSVSAGKRKFLVAEPEKALLDHWHLTVGEWTPARLEVMRYQKVEQIDPDRLKAYADRFHSPRLNRAVERWIEATDL
ncbi:MAG: type IV toxin-antitoxin system AbiEi family antitoxin domain-containing protein [Kiritimatiellia bacterium]|jgi:predicted transcriptional regulator of viral defense system